MEFREASFGLISGWARSNLPYWMIFFWSEVRLEKDLPLKDSTSTS